MGFVRYTMSYVHYYNVKQNSFTALEILCFTYPSLPCSHPKALIFVIYFYFYLFQTVIYWEHPNAAFSLLKASSFNSIFSSLSYSYLLVLPTFIRPHLDILGNSSYVKILDHISEFLVPGKVTYLQVQGIGM